MSNKWIEYVANTGATAIRYMETLDGPSNAYYLTELEDLMKVIHSGESAS